MPRANASHSASQPHSLRRRRNAREHSQNQSQIVNDSDSEDEEQESSSASLNDSKKKSLSKDEMDAIVGNVVYYLLRFHIDKRIILKSNIQKNIQINTKHYKSVMNEVKSRLKTVFGINLCEFENGKFIIINDIPNSHSHLVYKEEDKRKQILLFLLLTHIFMSGNYCQGDYLWKFLESLDISIAEPDPYFGDTRQIIEEFIHQKYIERNKETNEENVLYSFKWGVRAEQELSLHSILEFVEQVYGKPMTTFQKQYNQMLLRERIDNEKNQSHSSSEINIH